MYRETRVSRTVIFIRAGVETPVSTYTTPMVKYKYISLTFMSQKPPIFDESPEMLAYIQSL
jgi:hypothetical protein